MSQQSSRYTEAPSSSAYSNKGNSTYQTEPTTDVSSYAPSSGQSKKASIQNSQDNRENIRLVPIKVKDLMQMFQANPEYKGKSPVIINMKENEIDRIVEKQHSKKSKHLTSPQQSPIQMSPISLKPSDKIDYYKKRRSFEPETTTVNEETSETEHKVIEPTLLLGGNQPQVYAMTDIQAYPMIGGGGGFRANKSRKKTPRTKSRKKIAKTIKMKRMQLRPDSRKKSRSRSRFRADKSRSRSPRRRSRKRKSPRPKKIMRLRSRTQSRPSVNVRKSMSPGSQRRRRRTTRKRHSTHFDRDRFYCTAYPMCDYDCTPFNTRGRSQSPERRLSRPMIGQNAGDALCTCTLCQNKLQFIQPGVCSQKKNTWTNEYAIIPKPQVNLIDPCKELDPLIYPRAERPCIRDGRGNPLTDCIGRPLRDPIGKKFLNFSANGSVMDTNFRGTFYTGQPPLCVKCPLPGTSCAPDTTHNWWMSCGYPVRANMGPFFNNVVATENALRRC